MRGGNRHRGGQGPPHGQKRPRSDSSNQAHQAQRPGASRTFAPGRDARRGLSGPPRPTSFGHNPHNAAPALPERDRAASTSAAPSTAPKLFHPFSTNFNDHFETSRSALEDVLPVVTELRQLLRPSTPDKFTVYDPYYCSGTVIVRWNALGIQKVLHENRDFYEDVRQGTVPGPYDMLVTNPPFSDDHIIRMLNVLVLKQERPWAFLAPDYIVAKPWYKEFVRRHFTPAPPTGKGNINAPRKTIPTALTFALPPFLRAESPEAPEAGDAANDATPAPSSSQVSERNAQASTTTPTAAAAATQGDGGSVPSVPITATAGTPAPAPVLATEPFYLVPRSTYDFEHPTGAGYAHSHFKSMWYVWCGSSLRRQQEVMRGAKVALLSRNVDVVHGLVALKESGLVSALLK